MPALPAAPGVIRIDYHWSIGEDAFAKTRHFYHYTGTAPTNAQLNTFATAVVSSVTSHLIGLFNAGVTLTQVKVTDLSSSTAAVGDSGIVAVTGTRAGGSAGADQALLQSLEIHRRYRGGHPRIYWPFGGPNDLNDAQTWTTGFVTSCGTDLLAHETAITGAPWSGATFDAQVNVSFYNGFTVHTGTTGRARNVSTPRGAAVVDTVIDSIVRLGVAVIRKRLLGLA